MQVLVKLIFFFFLIISSSISKELETLNFKNESEICSKSITFHKFGQTEVCIGKNLRDTKLMNFHINYHPKEDRKNYFGDSLFHGSYRDKEAVDYLLNLNELMEKNYYEYVNSCCIPEGGKCIIASEGLKNSKGCNFAKSEFLENVKELRTLKSATDEEYWNPLINEQLLDEYKEKEAYDKSVLKYQTRKLESEDFLEGMTKSSLKKKLRKHKFNQIKQNPI